MLKIEQIKRTSILVVGDVMLDTYYNGEINRISPEAPVPVYRKLAERTTLGGAANVAANLLAANQNVSLMSIVGDDESGMELLSIIKNMGVDDCLMFKLRRKTTQKTRFLAGNNQQVLRMDVEDTEAIDNDVCSMMLAKLKSIIQNYQLILVSDYLKGLMTPEFTQGIICLGKEFNIPVLIDVKDPHSSKYKGAYLLKPNLHELRMMTGLPAVTEDEIIEAANHLRKTCECSYVLCTCGSKGMILVGNIQPPLIIKAEAREVFDVSGAGDTAIAYVAVGISNNIGVDEAVAIANIASGIQVGKLGTSSVYLHEVKDYLYEKEGDEKKKILSEGDIETFREQHSNKKVVFTNGCFDILHVGHKRYLQEASKFGDILVVGVNSDNSVRRLKGESRPVNNETDRIELLCALDFVDYVTLFDEDTPYELIKKIQPDVLVKGGDYKPEDVVGRDIVEAKGGVLKLVDFVEGKSTTNIINKISKR